MKSLCVKDLPRLDGREIYNDDLARSAELGNGRFVLEYCGRSIEFGIEQIAEATQALIGVVGNKLSIMAAARAVLFDAEEHLPAEAATTDG